MALFDSLILFSTTGDILGQYWAEIFKILNFYAWKKIIELYPFQMDGTKLAIGREYPNMRLIKMHRLHLGDTGLVAYTLLGVDVEMV